MSHHQNSRAELCTRLGILHTSTNGFPYRRFFAGIRWGGSNREPWRTSRGEHADERIRKSHLQVLWGFCISWGGFKKGHIHTPHYHPKKLILISVFWILILKLMPHKIQTLPKCQEKNLDTFCTWVHASLPSKIHSLALKFQFPKMISMQKKDENSPFLVHFDNRDAIRQLKKKFKKTCC